MSRTYVSEYATAYLPAAPRRNDHVRCCQKTSSFLCSFLHYLVCGLIAMAAGLVIWNHVGRPQTRQEVLDLMGKYNVSDFLHVLDELTDSDWASGLNEDPYAGTAGAGKNYTLDIWQGTDGFSGLTLTLQNALDSTWQTEFAAAVGDWQESEALTLTTVQVDVDNTCVKVEGAMKVCNGNYGATGWVGINEVEMGYMNQNGPPVILSSVAKMNEYYLQSASYAHRQYTMCHGELILSLMKLTNECVCTCVTLLASPSITTPAEIGHGFGLPHTGKFNEDGCK